MKKWKKISHRSTNGQSKFDVIDNKKGSEKKDNINYDNFVLYTFMSFETWPTGQRTKEL